MATKYAVVYYATADGKWRRGLAGGPFDTPKAADDFLAQCRSEGSDVRGWETVRCEEDAAGLFVPAEEGRWPELRIG